MTSAPLVPFSTSFPLVPVLGVDPLPSLSTVIVRIDEAMLVLPAASVALAMKLWVASAKVSVV